jgi:hypothetical protein
MTTLGMGTRKAGHLRLEVSAVARFRAPSTESKDDTLIDGCRVLVGVIE